MYSLCYIQRRATPAADACRCDMWPHTRVSLPKNCLYVAPSNSLFGPRHRHRTSGFDCPCLPSTPTWFHVCLDTARQLTVSSSQIHQNLIDQTWFFSSRTSDRPNRGACILSREAAKLKCRAPDLLNCSKPAKLRLCLVLFSKIFGNRILAFRSTK